MSQQTEQLPQHQIQSDTQFQDIILEDCPFFDLTEDPLFQENLTEDLNKSIDTNSIEINSLKRKISEISKKEKNKRKKKKYFLKKKKQKTDNIF